MNLFHYTRREYLASILATGLDHGDIPISLTEGVQGISLTEIDSSSPAVQRWTATLPEKLEYRLTVKLEPNDRLMRWRHVPKVLRMDLKWWKALGGDPYKWWVYFGTILPASIVEVRNTHTDHVLSPKETEEARQGARIKGVHYSTAIQWLRFEDALVTKTLIKEAA